MFSGDVTMATWGGSTVDNIEEIEENENDSGAGQEADGDEDDDGTNAKYTDGDGFHILVPKPILLDEIFIPGK